MEVVRQCDFFPKVDTLYLTRTRTGGLASILTYSLISVLVLVHGWQWLYPPTKQIITVPSTIEQSIPLRLDLTVSTACDKLMILHADKGGHIQMLNNQMQLDEVDFIQAASR